MDTFIWHRCPERFASVDDMRQWFREEHGISVGKPHKLHGHGSGRQSLEYKRWAFADVDEAGDPEELEDINLSEYLLFRPD